MDQVVLPSLGIGKKRKPTLANKMLVILIQCKIFNGFSWRPASQPCEFQYKTFSEPQAWRTSGGCARYFIVGGRQFVQE